MEKPQRLITRDLFGNYMINRTVLEMIKYLQSNLGILNDELLHKTYKVYKQQRSVYDLNHNSPKLLMAKIAFIVKDCKRHTSMENYMERILSRYGNHYNLYSVSKLFPVLPIGAIDQLKNMISEIWPWLNMDVPFESFYTQWFACTAFSFYGQWDEIIFNDSKAYDWINDTLDGLRTLVPEDSDKKDLINNIITRNIERISNEYQD